MNRRPITLSATSGQSKVDNGQGGADGPLSYQVTSTNQLFSSDFLQGTIARTAGSNVGTAINQGTLTNSGIGVESSIATMGRTKCALMR